jgi:hypothetical protein
VLGCGLLPARAGADPISAASLLEESTLVINQQSNVYAFTAPGAGTLTVQLDDIVWPTALTNLGLSINSPSSVLGSMSVDGSMNITVSHAGTYYANVSGQAGGPFDIGLYSLQVDFTPAGTPVPLPGAIVLLLGGLGLLGGLRLARWQPEAEGAAALP